MGIYVPILPESDWNNLYQQHLKSAEWAAKRQARLEMDSHACQCCGATERLEVHHRNYDRFLNENVRRDLITLCHDCHVAVHREKANQKRRKRK